jgi:hypothetical protein
MQISMFSAEEHPVSPSATPDSELDWMTRVVNSCSPSVPLLQSIGPAGWFGRTSPAFCHQMEDETLVPSSGSWASSGMGSPTEFLTLSLCEWTATGVPSPSDGTVCSLSDVLETGDVPQRYFLSAKACAGILRRAEKRGRALPPLLLEALRAVARADTPDADPQPDTLLSSWAGRIERAIINGETMETAMSAAIRKADGSTS